VARILHTQKMWEELAEDPFRGLRAGPATFSPFLFPAICKPRLGFAKTPKKASKCGFRASVEVRVSKKRRNGWIA